MIHPMPAQRIDTVVADPVTGDQRRRTDYAGTVWYGDRPQITGAMVMSRGATAQITTPFWLLDSHVYEAGATGNAQIQASAAVQGTSEFSHLLEVGAGLGQDPQDNGALLGLRGCDRCRQPATRRRLPRHRHLRSRRDPATGHLTPRVRWPVTGPRPVCRCAVPAPRMCVAGHHGEARAQRRSSGWRQRRPEKRLPGRAVIVAMTTPARGAALFNMGFTLQIYVEGWSPYEIEDQYFVSSRATLGHGMALPCKVDREDPQRVAIHWDAAEREAEQSTQARRDALAGGPRGQAGPGRARGGPGPGRWRVACARHRGPQPPPSGEQDADPIPPPREAGRHARPGRTHPGRVRRSEGEAPG